MSQLSDLKADLETYGYGIVPGVIPEDVCEVAGARLDDLDAREAELLTKGQIARAPTQTVVYSPDIVDPDAFGAFKATELACGVAEDILEVPFQLSSMAASRSEPEAGRRPHLDGRMPIAHPGRSTHFSVVYCVDDFTQQNGATMFWPYSHATGEPPPAGVIPTDLRGAVQPEATRGSAIFFLGSTWHEIAPNLSGARRWSIIVTYCRWWVKPTVDYRAALDESTLSPLERDLYGFTSQPPGPRDERHNTVVR